MDNTNTSFQSDDDETISVACVAWEPLVYVIGALKTSEIDYFIHGSRAYDIKVERGNVERAKQVLKEDATKNGYIIHLYE
jgi:hypothetical protein